MIGGPRLWTAGGNAQPPRIHGLTVTTLGSGGGADWWGRASIKRRPSDNALVMAYYRATAHDANDGFVHLKFSNNDGTSWTAEDTDLLGNTIPDIGPSNGTASQDAGEPWLYVCPNGDLLIHTWRVDYGADSDGTYQFRSTDGGTTWTEELKIINFTGPGNDLNTFTTDDDFVLNGVIYAGGRIYTSAALTDCNMILVKSTDNGATWEYVSDITTAAEAACIEVGLEYIGNDTILAHIRDLAHTNAYQRISTDLGATWGSLTDVTAMLGIAARQRIYTVAHLRGEANWWNDPRLVMIGFLQQNPGSSQTRQNVLWISLDRGGRWYGPFPLDTTVEDGGYGDIFAKADGTFGVISYHGTLAAASLKQYDFSLAGI